ncbi:RagB/SusD family nutrient uptake outer membrane protein [Muribaculaceae bacterium Isolate-114 (HZI)]|nr:RagB/SusD family nutrient uptake outer membrane protein [Muribaculaceae bacterium Isolate-114 (HZI)]
MKKHILFPAAMLLAASTLTSCEDYLTVESPDQLTSGNFWRNEADAQAGIAAAYSQLEYYIDTWEFAEVKWPVEAFREDVVTIGSDVPNYPNWMELYNFSFTNGNSQFTSYWSNNYTGISFANQVIEKVAEIPDGAIDPSVRSQIVKEARFLRAYYHLKLILNWKEIIVRDHYITDPDDLNRGLSSRTDTWDFIMQDLTDATSLPAGYGSDNLGRATCGAAYAYLGFANLTRAYEEPARKDEFLKAAVTALDKVTGYSLEKNYASMFDASNKNCKESVFELQTSMSTANGANYRTQMHRWIGCSELWGWDEILPSTVLMNEFRKEGMTATTGRYDSRMYATIFFKCDYYNDGSGRVYGHDYDDWFNGADKPAFRKFMPADMAGLETNYCAINVPLMRYSNVLLMKAEALNEQGHPELAVPLINEIRDVHGDMPPMQGTTQDAVRAQIEHERMIEFPLENWRWYDLRRWGKTAEALKNADRPGFDESKAFYPVPLTEINSNSAL